MMRSGRNYGTRMMRAKVAEEVKMPQDVLAAFFSVLCEAHIPDESTTSNQVPFRSINQDKPKLHLKLETRMSTQEKERSHGELEQLTSAISQMASRVNAQFVVDPKKTENFVAAGEQRDKGKKTA